MSDNIAHNGVEMNNPPLLQLSATELQKVQAEVKGYIQRNKVAGPRTYWYPALGPIQLYQVVV